jgi:large subunit ribosomal protein L3
MAIDFIIGKKVGMTRIFDDSGSDYPVTIVEAGPCEITQIKSIENEGYSSIQMGYLEKEVRHINKSEKGHFNKAGVPAKKILKEFTIEELENIELGQKVTADIFETGDFVAVSGVSKGKGFAGHMKRHGFSGGRRSHGKNSVMRKAGSIGAGSDPSRVWPGTRMAGRMGNENVTVKNLEVTRVEKDKNLVFIKGAVPGAKNGIVFISKI